MRGVGQSGRDGHRWGAGGLRAGPCGDRMRPIRKSRLTKGKKTELELLQEAKDDAELAAQILLGEAE